MIADIPGLIDGAHEGHGLGDRFLRHVSRTSLLLHLLDASGMSGRDPLDDYDVINRELALFDPAVAAKPQIVAANKIDAAPAGFIDDLVARFAARGIDAAGHLRRRRHRRHRAAARARRQGPPMRR